MTADRPAAQLPPEAIQIAEAQRDPSRFGALYEANFDTVYAYVARRVRNRSDAEDITSTVFQKALANLPRFEWRGTPFAAWLTRIAANEVVDRARSGRPPRALPNAPEAVEATTDEVEQRVTVFGLVRGLPPDQRRVVELRFGEDRTTKDIARALGRSEGAVKQLQFRAFQTLRTRLGETDG